MTAPPNGLAVMRTRAYLGVLVLAVVLGAPVAALAYGFLKLDDAGAAVDLHRPAEGARPPDRADLVAAAPPRGRRDPDRAEHPPAAGHRR